MDLDSFLTSDFLDKINSEVCLGLIRQSLKKCTVEDDGAYFDGQHPHVFVILGASVSFWFLIKFYVLYVEKEHPLKLNQNVFLLI